MLAGLNTNRFRRLMLGLRIRRPNLKAVLVTKLCTAMFASFDGSLAFCPMKPSSSGLLIISTNETPPPDSIPGTTSPNTNCSGLTFISDSVTMLACTYPSASPRIDVVLGVRLLAFFMPLRRAIICDGEKTRL